MNDSMDSYEELSNKNASLLAIKNLGFMALTAFFFAVAITLIDIAGIHYGHYMRSANGVSRQKSSVDMINVF